MSMEEMEAATPAEQVTAESGATEVEQQATPEATTEQTQEQQEDQHKDDDAKKVPWFQKRINEQTRKYYEAERKAQELQQRLAQYEQQQYQAPEAQQQAPQARPEDVFTLAEQIASQTLAERSFNDQCNRVYEAGTKELPGFDSAVANLQLVGVNREFLEAATASDAGHKLLHHLGQIENLPEAERILKLPPVQMGRELARLEAKLTAPPPPKPLSKAPPPISPVGTGNVSDNDLRDDLPIEEWVRRRNESLRRK